MEGWKGGREERRKEGRKEGRKDGRKEGRNIFIFVFYSESPGRVQWTM